METDCNFEKLKELTEVFLHAREGLFNNLGGEVEIEREDVKEIKETNKEFLFFYCVKQIERSIKMAEEWTQIGIRVKKDSNLIEKLREISKKTRMPYADLIELWVKKYENEPGTSTETKFFDKQEGIIEDIYFQINTIKDELKAIRDADDGTDDWPND
jgi:galactitol-specific phosphotransferase system IIB component